VGPVGPVLGQHAAAAPLDRQGREEGVGTKARRQDDHVGGVAATVAGHDGVRLDALDRGRQQRDVVALQRLVVAVGQQDALAPDRVVGREGRA
jgi:hypothetical protein